MIGRLIRGITTFSLGGVAGAVGYHNYINNKAPISKLKAQDVYNHTMWQHNLLPFLPHYQQSTIKTKNVLLEWWPIKVSAVVSGSKQDALPSADPDYKKIVVLQQAICANDITQVQQLLDLFPGLIHGVDEHGNTILFYTLKNLTTAPNECMIKLLIERGADPHKPNHAGVTFYAHLEKLGYAKPGTECSKSSSCRLH
jgi:hypothetical protein